MPNGQYDFDRHVCDHIKRHLMDAIEKDSQVIHMSTVHDDPDYQINLDVHMDGWPGSREAPLTNCVVAVQHMHHRQDKPDDLLADRYTQRREIEKLKAAVTTARRALEKLAEHDAQARKTLIQMRDAMA